MSIRVISLDDRAARLLEAGGDWSLHARFERALILARTGDGTLVSLVRHDLPDGPFTARLDRTSPYDLRQVSAPPRLDLHGAVRWRARPVTAAGAVGPAELARRLDLLERRATLSPGLERGIAAVASAASLAGLESALAAGDAGAAATAAGPLAGLGPGLTPSGDDLLAAALAFGAWVETAGLAAPGSGLRAAVVAAALPRTTRLAGQLLAAAADGEVTAPLAGLLEALLRLGATAPPDPAPLLAIGETSGADMLAGVRLAGRAWRLAAAVVPVV